eukprot:5977114-Prymnesium_polylepis.1
MRSATGTAAVGARWSTTAVFAAAVQVANTCAAYTHASSAREHAYVSAPKMPRARVRMEARRAHNPRQHRRTRRPHWHKSSNAPDSESRCIPALAHK